MKQKLSTLILCGTALVTVPALAVNFAPFGPQGQGGTKNGQLFQVGPSATMYELDAFLGVGGYDLNGSLLGTSAQLSRDPLPAGLAYSFTPALSNNAADAVLTYVLSNATSTVLFTNVDFRVFVDAEIGEATNTFFNEYATVDGSAGLNLGDPGQWQVDEPGFQTGTLFRNLYVGTLNNANSVPQAAPNDVAMALGFRRPLLWPGNTLRVQVMISEAGNALSQFRLLHHDVTATSTVLTLSGQAAPGGIAGTIFKDANTNSVLDPGEGLANVAVLLETNGAPVFQLLTDQNGHYDFGTPPGPGPVTVTVARASLPPGLTNTTVRPNPGTDFSATRDLGQTNLVLDWGYVGAAQQFVDTAGALQFAFLQWQLNRATGSLLGTLRITNPASSTATFGTPYQLGLKADPNFYYPHPGGTLPDGLPYVELSAAVQAQIAGGLLPPGQSVTLTNAVEIYSLTRSAPAASLFELWATQQ